MKLAQSASQVKHNTSKTFFLKVAVTVAFTRYGALIAFPILICCQCHSASLIISGSLAAMVLGTYYLPIKIYVDSQTKQEGKWKVESEGFNHEVSRH